MVLPLGFVVGLLLAVQEGRPVLERVPQLQETARKANGGALGCGVGTLTLITSRGEVAVRTGLDPIHVFGPTVKTADLMTLLKSRADSNRTGKPGPMSGKVNDLCYVCLSALAESKEPQAIPVIAQLLTDKDDTIRGCSVIALFRLGDSDEGLRAEVRKVRFPKVALDSAAARDTQPPEWLELGK